MDIIIYKAYIVSCTSEVGPPSVRSWLRITQQLYAFNMFVSSTSKVVVGPDCALYYPTTLSL